MMCRAFFAGYANSARKKKVLKTSGSPRMNGSIDRWTSHATFSPWSLAARVKTLDQPFAPPFLLASNVVANVRVVGGERRDLLASQLAGNGTHLLADVVASISILE